MIRPIHMKATMHYTTISAQSQDFQYIRNSPQLMGRQCVLMLENLLRLKDLGEEPWLRYELPASLVLRSSTGPAPGDK